MIMYSKPLLICFLLLLIVGGRAWADTTIKRLAPGVTLTQEIDKTTPLVINVLSVDLTAPGVHLGVGIGQDHVGGTGAGKGREDVSRFARRHGVLAAVNADYFSGSGDPLGIGIQDGALFSEPWIGMSGKPGPRATLGITPGRYVLTDTLGYLGDLQTVDGQRAFLNGINRSVGRNEIVAFTTLYGDVTAGKPGGTEVVLRDVNLPVRPNKLMIGRVQLVRMDIDSPQAIPADGCVLSGGPGDSAAFLQQHCHTGERVEFVLGVAPPPDTKSAVQIAMLPRTPSDLPSRAGAAISRSAWLWGQVRDAVGGGPHLLVNGQAAVDGAAEGFDASFTDHTHPRTAVGVTADRRHVFIVTVDGRQAISKGVTLTDLALILKRYGATDAINLDGGGSTVMAVDGLVVSSPSGAGSERPVADMLLVTSDTPRMPVLRALTGEGEASDTLRLLLPAGTVMVGSATPIKVADGHSTISNISSDVIWQGPVGDGVGFMNQRGYLIALKPGVGTISAMYKGHLLTGQVTVVGQAAPASVYTIRADFTAAPGGDTGRGQLTIRVLDQHSMPLPNAPVHIVVSGGTPDVTDTRTNADGDALVSIAWTDSTGGLVTVSSAALAPVTVKQP